MQVLLGAQWNAGLGHPRKKRASSQYSNQSQFESIEDNISPGEPERGEQRLLIAIGILPMDIHCVLTQ